jgi:hypothetical protein
MMTDWSNNYDLIRHKMERFVIEGPNDDRRTLKINHEDLPNTNTKTSKAVPKTTGASPKDETPTSVGTEG